MAEHTFEEKISVKRGIDLFKIENTARFDYPADLSNAAAPVKHVMDDAEIHYSIKAGILKWEIFGIAHMIGNLFPKARRQCSLRSPNQAVFEIKSNNSIEPHFLHEKPRAFAQPAADLKRAINLLRTNQPEPLGNLAFLKKDPHGTVYPDPFGPVHQHLFFSVGLDDNYLFHPAIDTNTVATKLEGSMVHKNWTDGRSGRARRLINRRSEVTAANKLK
jgi:hypothetical protein